jgi:hypothetical protein
LRAELRDHREAEKEKKKKEKERLRREREARDAAERRLNHQT